MQSIDIDIDVLKKEQLFAKSFNINAKTLEDKLTNNEIAKLSLEELVIAIILKYSKIELHHIIKDVRPRYYVKVKLPEELPVTRDIVHESDFKQLNANPKERYKRIGNLFSKHVLQNIDKPINAASRYFATSLGERYEIREDAIMYQYSYQYIDQRTNAELRLGKNAKFSITKLLNPGIKLMSGYYLRSHIEHRIIINKEVYIPDFVNKTDIKNLITYHVFFLQFKPDSDGTFSLFKNSKKILTKIKLEDLLLINCNKYVTKNEKSAYNFNHENYKITFESRSYQFIVDYTNTKDKYLLNDIFNILAYCEKNKINMNQIFNTYLYVIKNIDKYRDKSGRNAVFMYDPSTIDNRMKNVIAMFKRMKHIDTNEKGYIDFQDIKFKDVRKFIIRIIMAIITQLTFDAIIYSVYITADLVQLSNNPTIHHDITDVIKIVTLPEQAIATLNPLTASVHSIELIALNNPKLFPNTVAILTVMFIEEYGITLAGTVFTNLVTYDRINIKKSDLNRMIIESKNANPLLNETEIEQKLIKIRQSIFKKYYNNVTNDTELKMLLYKIQNTKYDSVMLDSAYSQNMTLAAVNDHSKRASTILGLIKTTSLLRYVWNGLVRTPASLIKYLNTTKNIDYLLLVNYIQLKKYKSNHQKLQVLQENIVMIAEENSNRRRTEKYFALNSNGRITAKNITGIK